MNVYPITIKIFADDEYEAQEAQKALGQFVNDMCGLGIRVTGNKIADVVPRWKENAFIRNKIIDHFKK